MKQATQPFSIGTTYSRSDIVAAWRGFSSIIDFRWMGSHAISGNTLFVFCGSTDTSEDGTEYYFVGKNLYRCVKNNSSSLPESFLQLHVFICDSNDSLIYVGCHRSQAEELTKGFGALKSGQNHIFQILSAHFANGFRLNSPIELVRFRSFAAEDFGEKNVLTQEELKRYISACGTTYDGKVYAVSVDTKERIKELADEYFSNGAQVIFFAEFYAKNENRLFKASVVSEDMLIDILRKLFPKLSFTKTYFGYTDASVFVALVAEILRVWGDDVLLTYSQLAERLRYIPLDRIKSALGQNADFIWSSVGTFSHVSRIEITDEERQVICQAAVRKCNTRNYASITDLPFGEIEERNYELSITAIHNAVYRICLSNKFDKKGKIVAHKGEVFDALTIMKKYCRTIDTCSFDDLLNFERELTGVVNRRIPLEASNTVLLRLDKDTFVADRYVHFNTDAIDETIGVFVKGDYLPLKSFTTFGAFPDCGQAWNLFLFESYCRRFSRKFRFDTPSVNSRNVGAVIRTSCDMDYMEIMTDAVANADVLLKDTAVSKFLYESGYTGKRTTAKANEIIEKAKAIRKRGE